MASLLNNRGGALMNTFTPPQRDYSLEYFTIESLQDGNVVSIRNKSCNTLPTFYYSTDSGSTWSSITATKSQTKAVVTIDSGETVLFKCTQNALSTGWDNYNGFQCSKNYIVCGNAMSLIYGDNFTSNSEFPSGSTHNLVALFREDTHIIDASNLILPAKNATVGCYNGMFRGCSNLAHPSQLLATIAAKDCCASMFEGCINLEEVPDIYFTNLDSGGNETGGCLNRMFCMSRTTTVTAKMTKSPVIYAQIINNGNDKNPPLNEMFKGNGSLVEVTCLATSIGNQPPTMNWLLNVSPTGTFYKHPDMNDWPTGVNGIPSGWTVVDYVES